MTIVSPLIDSSHGNLQKHQNPNRLQQALIHRFHQRIAGLVRQTAVTSLLDAGCGEGFVLDFLLREASLKVKVSGSDLRLEALQWAMGHLLPGLPASVADVHHLPYPDNAFPLVICLEVLEHLPDSSAGLRELARVSSDYLLLSVPHEPFFRGANFLRGKHIGQWGNDPEHLHNYSGRAFHRLINAQVDIVWHGYSFPWQIALARKRRSTIVEKER
jgi:SAM-dependent methyltransferase